MKEKSKKITSHQTPYGQFMSDNLKIAIRKAQQLNQNMKGGSNGRK
jgi:hypothetical protein